MKPHVSADSIQDPGDGEYTVGCSNDNCGLIRYKVHHVYIVWDCSQCD